MDENGDPLLTIVDFRTAHHLKTGKPILSVKTQCKTLKYLIDDVRRGDVRNMIPRKGKVVLVCETGNRDTAAIKFLSGYGYKNIVGLKYGMRGWIKLGYPVITER